MSKEFLDFLLAHLRRVADIVRANVMKNPVPVGLRRIRRVVTKLELVANPVHQFRPNVGPYNQELPKEDI